MVLLNANRQLAKKLELNETVPNFCTRTGEVNGHVPDILATRTKDMSPASLARSNTDRHASGLLSSRRNLYLVMILGGSFTDSGANGVYFAGKCSCIKGTEKISTTNNTNAPSKKRININLNN